MNESNNSSFTPRKQHEVHRLGFACFYAKPSECSGLCNVTLVLSCAGLQNEPPQPFHTASNLRDGCSPKRMPLLCWQSSVRRCAFNIPFKSWQRRSSGSPRVTELIKHLSFSRWRGLTVRTWVGSLHRAQSAPESAGSPPGCPTNTQRAHRALEGGHKQKVVGTFVVKYMFLHCWIGMQQH